MPSFEDRLRVPHEHGASVGAAADAAAVSSPRAQQIPAWITEQFRQLADGVQIRREGELLVLRLANEAANVEFQLSPAALATFAKDSPLLAGDSAAAEREARAVAEELRSGSLFHSRAFQQCCEAGYQLRSLSGVAERCLIEVNLAPGATIDARFISCGLTLRGTTAQVQRLELLGASTVELHVGELAVPGRISAAKDTVLRGEVAQLSLLSAGSHLGCFATELQLSALKNLSGEPASRIFKGLWFSTDHIDPKLFADSIRHKRLEQVQERIGEVNRAFLDAHLPEAKSDSLPLASHSGAGGARYARGESVVLPGQSPVAVRAVELELPAEVAQHLGVEAASSTKIAVLLPDDGVNPVRIGMALRDENGTQRFEELIDFTNSRTLYCDALYQAVQMSRGTKGVALQAFAGFARALSADDDETGIAVVE